METPREHGRTRACRTARPCGPEEGRPQVLEADQGIRRETGNGPSDGEKKLVLGPVELRLFGPKSKKRRYVCVATYVKCVPPDPDTVITGVSNNPVWPE